MKTFYFFVLSSFVVSLSSYSVQGSLQFVHGSSLISEGSKATFICQDTKGGLSLKITWSFQNNASDILLAEHGTFASGVNRNKYKLFKSGTTLQIANITVNDSGNYMCVIRGKDGGILLGATGVLNVKATFRGENVSNASQVFVSSTRPTLSPVTHRLQPSPTASYALQPAMMQRTVFHNTASASVSVEGRIATLVSDKAPPCENSTNSTGDVAFIENQTSPNLITVREGGQLTLRCSYCTVSPLTASLSWHKEGLVISNDSRHVIQKDELGIPVVEHSRDEGLYECVVTSKNQNISRFITVIVLKAELNPILSSVIAQNRSYLSVQVTWRLTDHGVFTFALVSLGLRLLNSSNWSHVINNISQYHVFYKFEHLQPCSQYLLNVTLHNKYKQTESKALVFWSAATNSSDTNSKTLLLYQVTNRRALGVALGIIGLLVFMVIVYACVTWFHDDKRGYSIPPGQQKRKEIDENDTLFSVTSSMYYNRAFEDDKVDWMSSEDIL